MSLTAFRIARQEFASALWTGAGARDYGGRWNSKGRAVVYAAQTRSLAAMEQLVHMISPRILHGFVVASITFNRSRVRRIQPADLPSGWDNPVAPASLRDIGDQWLTDGIWPVLAVPSAVVRGEWNYLFDPTHAEFVAMPKLAPEPFTFDDRLR